MSADDADERCFAGRRAFYGGAWTQPCTAYALHQIIVVDDASAAASLLLCEEHFRQAYAAGLIDFPSPAWEPPGRPP